VWWSPPVKLADACQLQPGLEVPGYRAVQQGLLGVAGTLDMSGGGAFAGEQGSIAGLRGA